MERVSKKIEKIGSCNHSFLAPVIVPISSNWLLTLVVKRHRWSELDPVLNV